MMIPIGIPSPLYFFSSGSFSNHALHVKTLAMAEKLAEHRRGATQYQELVSFYQWKIQRKIKNDLGYKVSSTTWRNRSPSLGEGFVPQLHTSRTPPPVRSAGLGPVQ